MLKRTKKQKGTNRFMLLWYSHPRVAIAISLIAVNLSVVLLFTCLLCLVSGNAFWDELAYIFTYTMCSDGIYDFVNSQEDFICFMIKLILTILQMIIFSGALIGFTTDVLQSTIDKRLNNLGKINLSNHYVFLNWSSIGPHLIFDLSFHEEKKNIVILAEEDRGEILNSIRSIFTEHGRKMQNIRLFIKSGNPNSRQHLSDISLDKAKYVGIMLVNLEDDKEHTMSNNDIIALKSLFAIKDIAKNASIVVEAESNETAEKIEMLIERLDKELTKRIIVFAHNSVLGHVLGKAIIHPTFSQLYHDLLSYDGCEFYGTSMMDVEEALYSYDDCIPIINYDDDGEVDKNGQLHNDQLYVLSDTKHSLGHRGKKKAFVKPLAYKEPTEKEDFSVFIFSRAQESSIVEKELCAYNKLNNASIECYSYQYKDDLSEAIAKIKEVKGKKKILLLSCIDANAVNQDEDIFLAALSFKLNDCLDKETEIFAEISNPLNMESLKNFGVMSVIVSNRIISLFMVQLLTHPNSKKFYRDLISTNGTDGKDAIDLEIKKAGSIIDFNENELSFGCKSELVQSFYIASGKKYMCIGIKHYEKKNNNSMCDGTDETEENAVSKEEEKIYFLCDRMDEPEEIILSKEDELILVKY